MASKRKYTKEFLEPLIKESSTYLELFEKIGVRNSGSLWSIIKKRIAEYDIDVSHFKGKGWSEDRKHTPVYPIKEYLSNERKITSNKLKNRLIREGLLEHKCYDCGLTKWKEKPIPIHLHHIDGNHENNNLDNLIILCPNCHAYQHKSYDKKIYHKTNKCIDCGLECTKNCTRCQKCNGEKSRKVKRPSKEQLQQDIIDLKGNICAIGRKYGVSDNSIRKWFKFYGLKK